MSAPVAPDLVRGAPRSGATFPWVLRGARMTARERVRTALRREVPDRVPRHVSWTPPARQALRQYLGDVAPEDAFRLDVRHAGPSQRSTADERQRRFAPYFGPHNLPDGVPYEGLLLDEWGMGQVPHAEVHYTQYVYPLTGVDTVDALRRYPWPDLADAARWRHVAEQVAALHANGHAVAGSAACSVFERAWYLRGMDQLFADWAENEDYATTLLDTITDISCGVARRFALAGVDVLQLGDDVGIQHQLLMSAAMWRRWLKPRLRRIIEAAREISPELLIWYHSDGFIEPLIPELIEIGVQVLNPVQPESMDPAALKRRYGDRLAFWGTIGIQTTLPFGTPEEVRQVVRERIETVGVGGGLLLAPTHVVQPDVPWENLCAFFEAIEEYGIY
jgi:uroporphyrinogen decarboxylase